MDPLYCALGFMVAAASTIVVIGAKRSVHTAARGESEGIDSKGASQFPITGSIVLFSLYAAYKFLPKEYLNMMLTAYLTLAGIVSISGFIKPYVGRNVATGCFCVAVGGAYLYTKHWILNNVLGFCLSIVAIESIQLQSWKVSAILLCGLFVYDIFWVFGTDVMVTVAKNVEGPIKILFPRNIFAEKSDNALLGLGDIVIPGLFIAQMLRFGVSVKAPGQYLNVMMGAYAASLINTMFVMVYFQAAQPALLYIVPWLLIGSVLLASSRGQMKQLWGFHDAPEESVRDKVKADQDKATADRKEMSYLGALSSDLMSVVYEIFGGGPDDGKKTV